MESQRQFLLHRGDGHGYDLLLRVRVLAGEQSQRRTHLRDQSQKRRPTTHWYLLPKDTAGQLFVLRVCHHPDSLSVQEYGAHVPQCGLHQVRIRL